MNKTGIEYLDFTWNPIAMRCSPISAGCQECWHIKRAKMLANNPMIPEDAQKAYAGRSSPLLIESRLEQPRKIKKPSMIGVQFMGDLFHDDAEDHQINSIFIKMLNLDWHTYMILTKRPERMKDFISIGTGWRGMMDNLWLGVTAENQQTADERIPILLQIPAKVRFVSVEPMLGPVDLRRVGNYWPLAGTYNHLKQKFNRDKLGWVICGSETGPGARPCPGGAIEDLYEQSRAAGIPFFDKRKNFIVREFPNVR